MFFCHHTSPNHFFIIFSFENDRFAATNIITNNSNIENNIKIKSSACIIPTGYFNNV